MRQMKYLRRGQSTTDKKAIAKVNKWLDSKHSKSPISLPDVMLVLLFSVIILALIIQSSAQTINHR